MAEICPGRQGSRLRLGVSSRATHQRLRCNHRSSSSTVQPLSRSRVPAMAAGAGRLCRSALREPPTGLGPDPLSPREAEPESAEGRGPAGELRVETGRGRHAPLLGRGRSFPPRPRPGLNGLARDGATHQLGNRLAKKLPARPEPLGRAEGLQGMVGVPVALSVGPLFSSRLPRGTCSTPQLSSAPPPASLPPQPPFPRRVILGTQSWGDLRGISPWDEKGEEPRRPARVAPSGLPGRGGRAAAAPRACPRGGEAGLERNIPGSEGVGWGKRGGGGALRRRHQREAWAWEPRAPRSHLLP